MSRSVFILSAIIAIGSAFPGHTQSDTPSAHSHNDYEQPKPFRHAFDRGFRSIEADVWLIDGRLLVAHDRKDAKPEHSLAALYLDPLRQELDRKGRWRQGPRDRKLQLLIDIKSEAVSTLEALRQLLRQYPSLTASPALTFAVSGNRPPVGAYKEWPAYIHFDGRPGITYDPAALARVALISDSWASYIDRKTLRFDTLKAAQAVETAHATGKPFRFWASPDNEAGWRLAARLGADYLNTDRIDALADFLASNPSLAYEEALRASTLHDNLPMMPYNRVIRSAGRVVRYGNPTLENHALDITRIEGTEHFAVMDRYGIAVIDADGRVQERFSYTDKREFSGLMGTYSGICSFRQDGRSWIAWPAGGGDRGFLMLAAWDGRLNDLSGIALEKRNGAKSAIPNGIALEPSDDPSLYVALNGNDEVVKIRFRDRSVVWRAATGVAPYAVALAQGRVFVTNWGGPRATDSTRERAGVPWGLAYTDPATGATARGSVSVFDAATGAAIADVPTGTHPNAILTSADGQHVYVANGNSDDITVIHTRNLKVAETIPVGLFGAGSGRGGASPNAISLDASGRRLLVSNGMDNAIAVVELGAKAVTGGRGGSRIKGYLPTEAYPAGSVVTADRIIVANLEGDGVNVVNPTRKARGAHYQLASLSIIPTPDEKTLAELSRQAARNALGHRMDASRLPARPDAKPRPIPERIGEPSVFKHVVYIIRENKTYDQVLGDLPQGRGDSSLCTFGERITPNTHALARQYGILDNYHASGKSSAEGHQWSNAAIVSDYVERNVRAWFRSYPHRQEDAMVYHSTGYIWNHAMDHGKKVRIYGEACRTIYDPKKKWIDLYPQYRSGIQPDWHNETTIARIRPVISPDFPDNDNLVFSDQQRADVFLREWEAYEKGDSLPHLMIVSLPNDHTSGLNPNSPTPNAMVADNDLALGRIVEHITRSRYFDSTLILVTQDDSQSGWDHISGYRTVGLAISRYSRTGVVGTQYNQTSMVRTIEQVLGLPPMHAIDAAALPMADCFTDDPRQTAFTSLPAKIPLDQMNRPLSSLRGRERRYALQSMNEVYDEVDGGEDDKMNRIIWYYTMGRKRYPGK
jgi:YVTN family beta-propeller protein